MKEKLLNWQFLSKAEKYIKANGSTISMVGAMVSLGLAIYSAFKASDDVSEAHKRYETKVAEINEDYSDDDDTAYYSEEKEKLIKEAKAARNVSYILAYKLVILFGGSSLVLMALAKWLDGIAIAGLTTLVAKNQDKLEKFMDNTKELIGEEKFQEIDNKTLEQLFLGNFTDGPVAFDATIAEGQMFFDTETGIVFKMPKDELEEYLEAKTKEFSNNPSRGLYLEEVLNGIGLEIPERFKHTKGVRCWGPNNPFKPYIGKRTILGMTISTVEYARCSKMPEAAGLKKTVRR